jgi:ABC-type branched-subunit amino acid transport system substrate-binding protein
VALRRRRAVRRVLERLTPGSSRPDAVSLAPVRRPRLAAALAAALLACVLLPARASPSAERSAAAPRIELRLGVITSFTGGLSTYGKSSDASARLAVTVIRQSLARLGLSSRIRVAVVGSEDDQSNPAAGVEAARKLVDVDHAAVIVGPISSGITLAVARSVTVPAGVLLISPGSSNPAITQLPDNDFVFRTMPSDARSAGAAAEAMSKTLKRGSKINIGTRNDAAGVAGDAILKSAWEARGGKVGAIVTWNPDTPTFDTEAQQLVAGNPAAWVINELPDNYAKLAPALVRTGKWSPARTFVSDGLYTPDLPAKAGRQATEGLRGVNPSSGGGKSAAAFSALFKKNAHLTQQSFDARTFDAVIVSFLASVRARSGSGAAVRDQLRRVADPPGRRVTFLSLGRAIRLALAGQDVDYLGATGPVNFDRYGDVTSSAYDIWAFRNGKIRVARTFTY